VDFVQSIRSRCAAVRREHARADQYAMLHFTNHRHSYASPDELDPGRRSVSIMTLVSGVAVVHPMQCGVGDLETSTTPTDR
jgi:hypothetical protein